MLQNLDTIYALSSGSLPSGVAVVRISGADALRYCRIIAGNIPDVRRAQLMILRDQAGMPIDKALVIVFKAPASFTGEDCVEFHLHGGRAVVGAFLDCLSKFDNTRHAEAGEFTRRAFENGKVDLVEAEGLSDIIKAETEMQRRLAMEQASGKLSGVYEAWAKRLTHIRAMIEAELDFSDEEDVPGSVSETVWVDVELIADEISQHVAGGKAGEIIKDGYQVVISGPPNVGKSSLINVLAKRDIAIVTDIPGTTRDVLEVNLDIGGYAVRLFDTAGLRETDDTIEAEGVRRAKALLTKADLVLVLSDAASLPARHDPNFSDLDCIHIGTKCDCLEEKKMILDRDLLLSSKTGEGLDELIEIILKRLQSKLSLSSFSLPVRKRQIDYLFQTLTALNDGLSTRSLSPEISSEALRRAAQSLGRITGRVDVEDLLDVIFSSFCVGK